MSASAFSPGHGHAPGRETLIARHLSVRHGGPRLEAGFAEDIQFMGFIYAGWSKDVSHAGRLRSRTRRSLSCPMVVRPRMALDSRARSITAKRPEAPFLHIFLGPCRV